jgi:predicted ABC-type exoprotein transport system permease subunit
MEQTKLGSLIEAAISTAIGFVVSIALAMIVYPMFGHSFTLAQNFWITVIFTIASIARSYAVRRWANARIRKAAQRMAAAVS